MLLDAIRNNNIAEVKRLLKTEVDVNVSEEDRDFRLIVAIRWLQADIVDLLIDRDRFEHGDGTRYRAPFRELSSVLHRFSQPAERNAGRLIARSILKAIFSSDPDVCRSSYAQEILDYPSFMQMSDMWNAEQKAVEQERATLQAYSFKSLEGSFSLLDLYAEKDENTLVKMSRNRELRDKMKEVDQGLFEVLCYFKRGVCANLQQGRERDMMLRRTVQILHSAEKPFYLHPECWARIANKLSTRFIKERFFQPRSVVPDDNIGRVWTPSNSHSSIR